MSDREARKGARGNGEGQHGEARGDQGRHGEGRGDAEASLLDALALPVATIDASGAVTPRNDAARALAATLDAALRDAARGVRETVQIRDRPHDCVWSPHGDGWVVALCDVSGHVASRERAEDAAHTDSLTGLPNRAALRAALTRRLSAAAEDATDIAVLLIDLDEFKPVNDTLGHAVGDALLRALAGRLRAGLREGDAVFRLGGDEFAVLVAPAGDGPSACVDAADGTARRIVDLASRSFLIEGQMARIGASVGVALSEGATDPDIVLQRADIALYRAKADGRSRHAHFVPGMDVAMRERRELELDLRRALALEQFELHYQPQFDLVDATVTGFEALIRWNHPTRGTVSPASFIPVAESSGMIVPIGEWVLREACREAAAWPASMSMSVNASASQFTAGNFVATVKDALARSSLDPRRLVVEITESVLLADSSDTMRTLEALRAMGVRVAMDDFGTGCSSLSYLRSFPFDIVKVDQSFVRGDGDRARREAIVRSVVALGREMDMVVTAEGVETMEQMEAIHRDGCAHAQGYLIGRPMPAQTARALAQDMAPSLLAPVAAPTAMPDASGPDAPAPDVPAPGAPTVPVAEAEPARPRVEAPPIAAEPGHGTELPPARPDGAEPLELYRLVYQSVSTRHDTEASLLAELDDILAVARVNNAALGITGALMFNGTHFAQVLEGDRTVIERLFETINLDPRHADVNLLSFEPVAERLFGHWSMAHVAARSGRMAELAALTGFDREALVGDALAEQLHAILVRDAEPA